uniref:Male-enhanced antigen 1 n=2 Tax=Amphimedon queenslandica TaxID=400682 RepID=A0A1X7VFR8_AMPQE
MNTCLHVVKVSRGLRINTGLMEDGGENESQSVPTVVMMNGDISDEEDEEGVPDPETGYILLPMNLSSGEDEENGEEEVVQENSETLSPASAIEVVPQSVSSPDERSSSSDPPMEESQAEAIRQAMTGLSLSIAPPSWAQNLPEDVWKQELLDGIRKQKQ